MDGASAQALISNLVSGGALDTKTAKVMAAAVSAAALRGVAPENRDALRAGILKQMLIHLL